MADAAIKHIRKAEALALELSNTLAYASFAAADEKQYLIKCVLHDLRVEVGATRERLGRMRVAQEQDEAGNPRFNRTLDKAHAAVQIALTEGIKHRADCMIDQQGAGCTCERKDRVEQLRSAAAAIERNLPSGPPVPGA